MPIRFATEAQWNRSIEAGGKQSTYLGLKRPEASSIRSGIRYREKALYKISGNAIERKNGTRSAKLLY
jgi:hypothetical protein